MSYYPIGLELHDRACVVVGGGQVAARRVAGLLECGARVTVIAPVVSERLRELADDGKITLERRTYAAGDLAGAALAMAATDAPAVNAAVAAEARARGVLVNVADDGPRGDFIVMARVRRGGIQLAISTDGRSPALTRRVREDLERLLPPEYDALLGLQAELRGELRAADRAIPPERWQQAADETVLAALRAGDRAGARDRLRARLLQEAGTPCS